MVTVQSIVEGLLSAPLGNAPEDREACVDSDSCAVDNLADSVIDCDSPATVFPVSVQMLAFPSIVLYI